MDDDELLEYLEQILDAGDFEYAVAMSRDRDEQLVLANRLITLANRIIDISPS